MFIEAIGERIQPCKGGMLERIAYRATGVKSVGVGLGLSIGVNLGEIRVFFF